MYESNGCIKVPALIHITDNRRNWQGNLSYEDDRTKIRNILIDNINVLLEEGIEEIPAILVEKKTQKSVFENINIQNIFINGKKLEISQE